MTKFTLGDKEWNRYKKIQEENKKLKREVKKLRSIIEHANLKSKMDPKKKLVKQIEEEKDIIKDHDMCPNCKGELKSLYMAPINRIIYLCKNCNYRRSVSNPDQSE